MIWSVIVWLTTLLLLFTVAVIFMHRYYLPPLARWLKLPITFSMPRLFTMDHITISTQEANVTVSTLSLRIENYRFKVAVGKVDFNVLGKGVPPGQENLGLENVVGKTGGKLVEAMGKNLMRIVQAAKDLGVWKDIAEANKEEKNTLIKCSADIDTKGMISIWRGIINNIESTILMILFKTVIFDLSDVQFKLCANLIGINNKLGPFNKYLKKKALLKYPLIIGLKISQPALKLDVSKVEGFIIILTCSCTEILSEDEQPVLSLDMPRIKFNIMPTPVFSSPKLALLSSSIQITIPTASLALTDSLVKAIEGMLTLSLITSVNDDDSLHTVVYDRDILKASDDAIPALFVPSNVGSLLVHFEKLTIVVDSNLMMIAHNLKLKIKGRPKFRSMNIIEYYQEIKVKVDQVNGKSDQSDFLTLKQAEFKLETMLEKKKGYDRIQKTDKITVKVCHY